MRTKIYAYKGIIAAETDLENGEFWPNPSGIYGLFVPVTEIDITAEAKELIRNAPISNEVYAPIRLLNYGDEYYIDAAIWLSGSSATQIFYDEYLCIGCDSDTSILNDCNETEIELPEEFVKIVDEWVNRK